METTLINNTELCSIANTEIGDSIQVENHDPEYLDWADQAGRIMSDPNVGQGFKYALTAALDQDPMNAANDAEAVYRIVLERAVTLLGSEMNWRRPHTRCWKCKSDNSKLVREPGYGVVHECMDCGDQGGRIQWPA